MPDDETLTAELAAERARADVAEARVWELERRITELEAELAAVRLPNVLQVPVRPLDPPRPIGGSE